MPLKLNLEAVREVADLPIVFPPHLIRTMHGLQLLMVGQQPCPMDYLGLADTSGGASALYGVRGSCGNLLGVIWFELAGA